MKEFKIEVGKVGVLLSSIMTVFKNPSHDLLALLLQNLSFDGSDCKNYDKDEELNRAGNIVNVLKELKKYNKSCPVTQFICTEVDMLYTGYVIMGGLLLISFSADLFPNSI